MPTALVTGANGFVGSHLAEELLARGWRVRALVRTTSNLRFLPERAEKAYGEIVDPRSLEEAVEGADTVFHVAGVVRAPGERAYEKVNAEGAGNLARAAASRSTAPRRFVLVSSLAAGGASERDRPRREEDPEAPKGAYGRSKLAGERAIRDALGRIPWTILRPPSVYGPRDTSFLMLGRLAKRGWTPRLGGGQRVSVIHVRDLVRGILAASESDAAVGRIYYPTHPRAVTWEECGRYLARGLGKRAHAFYVPGFVIPWVGRAGAALARAAGRPNPVPADRLRDLLAPAWTCDPSRSEAELGFRAEIDAEPGLAETARWYREEGWL